MFLILLASVIINLTLVIGLGSLGIQKLQVIGQKIFFLKKAQACVPKNMNWLFGFFALDFINHSWWKKKFH